MQLANQIATIVAKKMNTELELYRNILTELMPVLNYYLEDIDTTRVPGDTNPNGTADKYQMKAWSDACYLKHHATSSWNNTKYSSESVTLLSSHIMRQRRTDGDRVRRFEADAIALALLNQVRIESTQSLADTLLSTRSI